MKAKSDHTSSRRGPHDEGFTLTVDGRRYFVFKIEYIPPPKVSPARRIIDEIDVRPAWKYMARQLEDTKHYCILIRVPISKNSARDIFPLKIEHCLDISKTTLDSSGDTIRVAFTNGLQFDPSPSYYDPNNPPSRERASISIRPLLKPEIEEINGFEKSREGNETGCTALARTMCKLRKPKKRGRKRDTDPKADRRRVADWREWRKQNPDGTEKQFCQLREIERRDFHLAKKRVEARERYPRNSSQ